MRTATTRRNDPAHPRLRRPVDRTAVVRVAISLCVIALVGMVAGGVWLLSASGERAQPAPHTAAAKRLTASTVNAGTVEVPDVTGMPLEEATVVLSAGGFIVASSDLGSITAPVSDAVVTSQRPVAGTVVASGTRVEVFTGAQLNTVATPLSVAGAAPAMRVAKRTWTVCIDPGHQSRSDSAPEPIGPGSTETKGRVTGGATGIETRIPEHEIALQISMNIKSVLEARGVRVVMTRTTSDVNLSNGERATVANRAHADLFLRVHGDGSPDDTVAGISTLYPASNQWTRSFAATSKRAAQLVQSSVVAAAGAVDRGTVSRSDLSGFNWSKNPVILVECGFMSNSVEDRLLSSPHYQDKLAAGIADGVLAYLEEGSR